MSASSSHTTTQGIGAVLIVNLTFLFVTQDFIGFRNFFEFFFRIGIARIAIGVKF